MQLIEKGDTKFFSLPRIEPDLSRLLLDQTMAASNRPCGLSCYHCAQEGIGDCDHWQLWHDGYMQVPNIPVHAYRTSQAGPAPYNPGSLIDIQNDFEISAAALNVEFFGIDGYPNGSHDFFRNSETTLPQYDAAVVFDEQFRDWTWAPNITSFQSTAANPPLIFDVSNYSPLNQMYMTEFGDSGGLNQFGVWPAGLLDSVSNQLDPTHAVSWPLPCNNGNRFAGGISPVDFCIPGIPQDSQDISYPLSLTAEHQFSGIPSDPMSIFTGGLSSPLQIEGYWNPNLQEDTIDNPFRALPSHLSPETISYISCNSFAKSADHTLPEIDGNISGQPAKGKKGQIYHRPLLAKHTGSSTRDFGAIACSNISTRNSRKGRRKSTLTSKQRERTAEMRKKNACVRCFVNHTTCSFHEICFSCQKSAKALVPNKICARGHLKQYFDVLLPSFLVNHLDQAAIKDLTDPLKFINNETTVQISTSRSHPPVSLLVSEFIPPNQEFLLVPDSAPESNGQKLTLAYGLHNYSVVQLKQKLWEHIEIVSNSKNMTGKPETLTWKVLRAIFCFQEADPVAQRACIYYQQCLSRRLTVTQNNLLRQAIAIHSIHYIEGVLITFCEDSAANALRNLRNPPTTPPSPHKLSARVLNRQIKGILNLLLQDLQKPFLEDFDGELKRLKKDTWLLCLCTNLVFCMCIEQVQLAVDGFVGYKISNQIGDPNYILRCGKEISRRLEACAVDHSSPLLTRKLKHVLKEHNVFKHSFPVENDLDHSESEINLINSIRDILANHEDEIREKGCDRFFGGSSRGRKDHLEFRKTNTGRLISKVLIKLY